MKPVEDAFASDVFRRVVLPGIVLTAGFHPILAAISKEVGNVYQIGPAVLLVAEIIVLGLGASSGIQWIYYVYEGFRLEWITSLSGKINRRRVRKYQSEWDVIRTKGDYDELQPSVQARVLRIYEYLLDFPLTTEKDGKVRHIAERPTRLGNIIATYEGYAESRYGIDGTFFWDHLLMLTSDSSRKRFEDNYSFAENLVLTSFAGAVVALVHAVTLFGLVVGSINESLVVSALPFGPGLSGGIVLFGMLVWYVFYKASLPAHRDAGAVLRAIVDTVVPHFVERAKSIQVPLPADDRERIEELNEYLKGLARPQLIIIGPHRPDTNIVTVAEPD